MKKQSLYLLCLLLISVIACKKESNYGGEPAPTWEELSKDGLELYISIEGVRGGLIGSDYYPVDSVFCYDTLGNRLNLELVVRNEFTTPSLGYFPFYTDSTDREAACNDVVKKWHDLTCKPAYDHEPIINFSLEIITNFVECSPTPATFHIVTNSVDTTIFSGGSGPKTIYVK